MSCANLWSINILHIYNMVMYLLSTKNLEYKNQMFLMIENILLAHTIK